MKDYTAKRIVSLLSPPTIFLLWEICARMGWIDIRFFPAPSEVLIRLIQMAKSGDLWRNLFASLYRLFWGFWIGAIPAVILGMIMGLSSWVRAIMDPLVAATYPIPKSAIIPLLLLIFGLGEASKIAVVTIGVFFPVLINTATGVMQIPRIHFDVGHNFGASRSRVLTTIAFPGALPMILAGVKLAVGVALILVVVAEMVGAKSGIGFLIVESWSIFDIEGMYAGLVVISALGYGSTLVLSEFERLLVPWKVLT